MRLIIAGGRDYQFTEEDKAWLDAIHAEYKVTCVVSGCAGYACLTGLCVAPNMLAGENYAIHD